MVLDTKRLQLNEFSEEDAVFILELLNEPAFIEQIADKGVRSIKDAERYLMKGPMASYREFGFGLWRVALKTPDIPIGMCGLLKRDYLKDVDIGFAFLAEHCQKGYAFEAAAAVMTHATGQLGLKKIVAIVNIDNDPSTRLLGKLKFRFERHIRLPDEKAEVKLMAYEGNGQYRPAVSQEEMAIMTETALDASATGAVITATRDIVVRDELADRCQEPGCEKYGKSKRRR